MIASRLWKSSVIRASLRAYLVLLCTMVIQARPGVADERTDGPLTEHLRLPVGAKTAVEFDQIVRAWSLKNRSTAWDPAVNDETARGAADVYARVAPAVVVVRTPNGHGTGFVIDADGWIVTNHHVVVHSPVDARNGVQVVTVHRGRLKDGLMELDSKGMKAYVYKRDPNKDLALLKVVNAPRGPHRLPVLEIADRSPSLGASCLAIGHPAAAMLWTLRSGVVSAAGIWPKDMIDYVMAGLVMTKSRDRRRLRELIAAQPRRKVVISSCSVNPGDSGGPLVDEQGRVIAVTFAMPGEDSGGAASAAKFAYHVHLDELREFLKNRPDKPALYVPDPLPPATLAAVDDLDHDGVPDVLVFGMQPSGRPSGLWLDLDQNSAPSVNEAVKRGADLDMALWQRLWDYEFALHTLPQPRAFYDTDDDGTIDVILLDSDRDGRADSELRLVDGQWKHGVANGRKLIDPQLIRNEDQQRRLAAAFRLKSPPRPAP